MGERDGIEAVLAAHAHPGELLYIFGEAWMVCSCGHQIDIQVIDGRAQVSEGNADHRAHVAAALREAGYGDVRAAKAEAWDEGYARRGDAAAAFGKEAPVHLAPPNPYRTAAEQVGGER